MKFFGNIILTAMLLIPACLFAQYIQVNDSYTAQQLVEDVLIDSPCANVSNFSVSGDIYSSAAQSYGYFTGAPGFPFADGIVLSTASAYRSEGPNSNLIDEGNVLWQGDQDLEQALNINTTFNATVLEFDFVPLTSEISFDYIFASEEYQGTAPCNYSDGFAFLLKPVGSTDPYQNLALIPYTSTPVLVTSVHPQISGGNGCSAQNEEYFGGFNGIEHPTNYNGQTVVMTARASVIPGTLYHIKLVIADEQNIRYDSAIFLGGGSFNVGTDIGPDRLIATSNPVCEGDTHLLDAIEPGSNTYQWFKDGTAISGETAATYTVTTAGVYTVEVNLGSAGCIALGEAVIEYVPLPIVSTPVTIVQCDPDGDGVTYFDLAAAEDTVTMGAASSMYTEYYESLSDAQNETSPITNSAQYQSSAGSQVFAKVKNDFGCFAYAVVNLQISNNTIAQQPELHECDDTNAPDGFAAFDLSEATPVILTGLPAGLTVSYYATPDDAVLSENQLPNNYTNTTVNQQTIFASVVNGPDCYDIVPVVLNVHTLNPPNFGVETVYVCDASAETLTVANTFSSYLWSTGATSNTISVTLPGLYSVTVTDVYGCSRTKNFTVIASGIATIDNVSVSDFAGGNNTAEVLYSGDGDYEFSLDGNLWQQTPVFTSLASGEYNVFIRDINGCGIAGPVTFFVMDYPKYFTPNGDGFNDIWKIKYLESMPGSTVSIFDRYGKLIYSFSGNAPGWDGKMNTAEMPSSDYWFVIRLETGRTVKSHFTLKR